MLSELNLGVCHTCLCTVHAVYNVHVYSMLCYNSLVSSTGLSSFHRFFLVNFCVQIQSQNKPVYSYIHHCITSTCFCLYWHKLFTSTSQWYTNIYTILVHILENKSCRVRISEQPSWVRYFTAYGI